MSCFWKLNMINTPTPDYEAIVKQSGIATTHEEWRVILKKEMEREGSNIANNSTFSPFWRLIENAIIHATTWLINKTLIQNVLPNTFLATASGEQLKLMAWECQMEQKLATKTKGVLLFTRASGNTHSVVIPKNTWVQTNPINGKVYRVSVSENVTLIENETTVSVPVIAENEGEHYNLGGGYYSILPIAIAGIGHVSNEDDWIISPGQNVESDDDLRIRIRNQWSAVARWHIDAAYRSLLMKESGLQHDNIYFEHEAPRGPATANALILMDSGEPSESMIKRLNTLVMQDGNHGHGDDLLIIPMPSTMHALSVKLWFKLYVIDENKPAIIKQVDDCIRSAFRENLDYKVSKTTPVGKFSFSKLEGEIHNLFDTIETIRFNADFIESRMTIPRLSELEIIAL